MLKSIYDNTLKIKPIAFFVNRITSGHERSVKAKKNIIASFFIRGCSMVTGLTLVPLTIHYINPTQYGIWLTLSSIIGWFSLFDIGFGNGLRNRFGEAIAKGERKAARIYVSTTYAILSIIILACIILFLFINPFLNWAKILNAPGDMAEELSLMALIVFVFFCLRFVLKLISTVIIADQQPAKAQLFDFFASLFSLIVIFILTKTTRGSLLLLATALSTIPIIVLVLSSIWFYSREYKDFAPSLKFVDFSYARSLMGIGLRFFVINIAGLIAYETTNIVITQIIGPEGVTVYNLSFKYFSILTVGFSMLLSPFWNAFTEAKVLNDYVWMKRMVKKLINAWFILLGLAILFLFSSSILYKLWFGTSVTIPFDVSLTVCFYVIVFNWCAIFSQISAGFGKIKLQLYVAIFSCFVNIPFSIFLGRRWGIVGVVLATAVVSCISAVWNPIQIHLLMTKKAKGIWNE